MLQKSPINLNTDVHGDVILKGASRKSYPVSVKGHYWKYEISGLLDLQLHAVGTWKLDDGSLSRPSDFPQNSFRNQQLINNHVSLYISLRQKTRITNEDSEMLTSTRLQLVNAVRQGI